VQSGRYQAEVRSRQTNTFDALIFDCINGAHHWFIIPAQALGRRRQVQITSYLVGRYKGQWAPYLGAWELIADLVDQVRHRPQQLSLFESSQRQPL
jgi:hypothetical protein